MKHSLVSYAQHFLRNGCVFLALILLGGCTSVGSFRGISIDEGSVYINGVPPIKQDAHYACGAASVAAVAAFWSIPLADFKAKHPQVPGDTTGHDLEMLAQESGLQAFAYRGSMEDLQENLRKGRPLIVMISQPLVPSGDLTSYLLINAWDKWGAKPPHWVVVVGLTKENSVIIQDPASGPMVVKPAAFQAWWAEKDNLTVLVAAR